VPISRQCIARHRSSLIAETKIPFKTYENIPKQQQLKVLELEVDERGDLPEGYTQREVSKMDLAVELGVSLRDLRCITDTSPQRRIASILTRPGVIILHIEPVQAIIQHNRILVFGIGKDPFLQKLSFRLPYRINRSTASSFEFKALEAVLIELVEQMDAKARDLEPEIETLLEALLNSPRQKTEDLLQLKRATDRLNSFDAEVLEVSAAINGILENDEDMVSMYLTNAYHNVKQDVKDHQEVETMLEIFHQQVTEIDNRISQIKSRIKTTEDYVKTNFDVQRNRLIRTNLFVSLASLGVAVSAMGAGVFGMNLKHGFEESASTFPAVTATILGLGLVTSGVTYYLMFPRAQKQSILDKIDDRKARNCLPDNTLEQLAFASASMPQADIPLAHEGYKDFNRTRAREMEHDISIEQIEKYRKAYVSEDIDNEGLPVHHQRP
jgi:magnesium transporter